MTYKFNPFTGNLDIVKPSIWKRVTDTVVNNSTGIVDAIDNNLFKSLKYIVTVYNNDESFFRSFELNVLNINGSYKETLTHKIRSTNSDIDVVTVNNAGTFELRIVNNENFSVTTELAKLVLP